MSTEDNGQLLLALRKEISDLRSEVQTLTLELRTYTAGQVKDCAAHRSQMIEHHTTLYGSGARADGVTQRLQRVEDRFGVVWGALAVLGVAVVGLLVRVAVRLVGISVP